MRKRYGYLESVSNILSSRRILFGINPCNLIILRSAWEREMSPYKKYFDLEGVEKSQLVIKAVNSSVASEVKLRKNEIIKKINGYFRSAWIKDLKVVCKF